jgi:hypothetical protein
MKCVTTVRYRIKVNGELSEEISPQWGLRQGDPLSPYLFLICAEAFSCLLLAAETTGELFGIKVCQNVPSINHLLFADDSLLLLKANEWSANHLQNILSLYEDCSGQTINKDKSLAMFSKNTKNAEKSQVMSVLNISTEAYNEKCLGLCWHFLASLKLGCHPQHDARNMVLNKCKCSSRNKYEIRKRTDNTDVAF